MSLRRRKNNRTEIKLTAEGWVFLVVLAFITLGAVLRNVNLLVVLAGMMFAPLLLNWRMAIRWLKSMTASRRMPVRLHAHEVSSVQWTCENRLSGMAVWNLVINDRITCLTGNSSEPQTGVNDTVAANEGWVTRWFGEILRRMVRRKLDPNTSEVKIGWVRVNAGQSEAVSYRLFFSRRGRYVIGPAALSTTFPFGLIVSRVHYPELETIHVAPQIGELHPAWERRVQSTAVGSDAIKRRRALEEDEFYALRPWRSGDSKKNIHWRTSAKFGQPIVKQHDQPNNRDFAMILDLYADPGGGPEAESRVELALSFMATAILQIGAAVQGQIAIGICGHESDVCQSRSRQAIVNEVMKSLAIAKSSEDPEVIDVFLQMAGLVSRGTPIYLVSTRSCPRELDLQFIQDQNQGSDESQRQAKQLRRALPMLRWIEVGSKEFDAMFTMTENELQESQLNRFSTRWSTDARR